MNEWITDRLPTEADADDIGRVWVCWSDGTVVPMLINKFDVGLPWQPKEKKPGPYLQTKPKRGTVTVLVDGVTSTFMEMRDGDIDPDEALAMRERMESVAADLESLAADTDWILSDQDLETWCAKLRGEQ